MAVTYLIRHAQASFGSDDYDQLSPTGVRQAAVLGEALADRIDAVDLVVTGGMRRHDQTTDTALRAMGIAPERTVDKRWAEFDHEDVVRRHLGDAGDVSDAPDNRGVQGLLDIALANWVVADDDDGESWSDFTRRVESGLDDLIAGSFRTALVFTSGGVISAVCARMLGLPASGWIALNRVLTNASVTKLVHGRRGTTLVSFNDHGHLESGHRDLLTYR